MAKDELFQQAVAGIKPLIQDKAELPKPDTDKDFAYLRAQAVNHAELGDNTLSDAIELLDKQTLVGFKRPGIQHGVYKKLRLGHYISESTWDMHGLTVDQARQALPEWIRDCLRYDVRVLTIVHGKGQRSEQNVALLKSHLVHWLKQISEVMAFHSAQAQHGGSGALYVLLRKSEAAKDRNREKFRGRHD